VVVFSTDMMKFIVVILGLLVGESLAMYENLTCRFHEPVEVARGHKDLSARLWRNGIVPYKIHSSFTNDDRDYFYMAIEKIEQQTCISFKRYDGWGPFLELSRECYCGEIGCYQAGYTDGLGSDTPRRLVLEALCHSRESVIFMIHEIFHALGVGHTQNRKDRDEYIKVLWNNIDPTDPTLRYQYEKCSFCEKKPESPYDCNSIMHYRDDAYSIRPGFLKTMIPKVKNCDLTHSLGYVPESDWKLINNMYQC